jgi:hypothetical protein
MVHNSRDLQRQGVWHLDVGRPAFCPPPPVRVAPFSRAAIFVGECRTSYRVGDGGKSDRGEGAGNERQKSNLKQRSRAGRPRQPGPGTKSGRRKPIGQKSAPTTWRRIYDEGVAVGLDPRLGTEIGRLALAGHLTETQATAGVFVGNWYAQAANALPPRRTPVSPLLMAGARPEAADRLSALSPGEATY